MDKPRCRNCPLWAHDVDNWGYCEAWGTRVEGYLCSDHPNFAAYYDKPDAPTPPDWRNETCGTCGYSGKSSETKTYICRRFGFAFNNNDAPACPAWQGR